VTTILDTFTRTDLASLGDADTGQTWVPRPWAPWNAASVTIAQSTSVWATDGAKAYSTDGAHQQMATIDHGVADGTFYVDLFGALADGTGAGLTFRWQDATHYWNAFVYNGIGSGNYYLFLQKQDGAGAADRTAWNFFVGTVTTTTRIEVVLEGDSITANYYDGGALVLIGSIAVTDSLAQSATDHGIMQFFTTDHVITTYNW
jgi:hypothetical protein